MNKSKWLLEKIAGYGACTAVSIGFDDILWPIAVAEFGSVYGGLMMSVIALVMNLLLFYAYDSLKRDIFGFERIRELQHSEAKGWMKIVTWALKGGTIPTFVVLSYYDPFLAVVFVRAKANHFRMTLRDWYYFGLSMFIGCVGVTVFWSVVIELIKMSWKRLF